MRRSNHLLGSITAVGLVVNAGSCTSSTLWPDGTRYLEIQLTSSYCNCKIYCSAIVVKPGRMFKSNEAPLLPGNQQEQIERQIEREKALTQKTLAPILLLTIALTATLAFSRSNAIGFPLFAFRR